jgi:hypothetical protein
MCDRIHLCHDCLWPICFPWGQKTHIGTGWYCWKEHHADDDPLEDLAGFFPFEWVENAVALAQLLEQLQDAYVGWKKDRSDQRVIRRLRELVKRRRTGVVHDFIQAIHRDPEVGSLLRVLTQTREWRSWATAARRRLRTRKVARGPRSRARRPPEGSLGGRGKR